MVPFAQWQSLHWGIIHNFQISFFSQYMELENAYNFQLPYITKDILISTI